MTSPIQVVDNRPVVEQKVRMQGLTTGVHKCVGHGFGGVDFTKNDQKYLKG